LCNGRTQQPGHPDGKQQGLKKPVIAFVGDVAAFAGCRDLSASSAKAVWLYLEVLLSAAFDAEDAASTEACAKQPAFWCARQSLSSPSCWLTLHRQHGKCNGVQWQQGVPSLTANRIVLPHARM
jgi:hypothetical protein